MDVESERIIAAAAATATIKDSLGRELEVKKLSRREIMRHMRQWGAACNVEGWFALALMASSVKSIDGKPLPTPQTVEQVEALADLLGDEGGLAVGEWYQSQQSADFGEERLAAKN